MMVQRQNAQQLEEDITIVIRYADQSAMDILINNVNTHLVCFTLMLVHA